MGGIGWKTKGLGWRASASGENRQGVATFKNRVILEFIAKKLFWFKMRLKKGKMDSTEVSRLPDSLTVSWQREGKEWTVDQRTRSASLSPDAASRKENKELGEVQQSRMGSLAEASRRSFGSSAKGEGSNRWQEGAVYPRPAVSHVSNTFYTSQAVIWFLLRTESDRPVEHNTRNKAAQKQASLCQRFVLQILFLQHGLQPSFCEATW